MAARLRVLEERMAGANVMIEKIDHLIVRMNGQSTPYRDELESIVTEYGFWVPRGEGSGDSSSHGGYNGPAAMGRAARWTCVEGMPHRCMFCAVLFMG
jgi:hypothetical protein